jgi:Ribonuclease D
VARIRNQDELWRIRGSGVIRGRTAAVLRALWQWREKEAEKADRPPFHILQNEDLLKAAAKFASGSVPDYRHFSFSRRQAFREAAQAALRAPESEWPVSRRRSEPDRPLRQSSAQKSCGVDATNPLRNSGWNLHSLHRAARLR